MAKRPSYVSIRARQAYLLRAIETKGLTYEQAGRLFGESRATIRDFVETQSKALQKQYNRSTTVRRMYAKGTRINIRETTGLKRVTKFAYEESAIDQIRTTPSYKSDYKTHHVRAGERIQPLYTTQMLPRNILANVQGEWAAEAKARGIPVSIHQLRFDHRNNKLSDTDYLDALNVWKDIYGVSDSESDKYYADVADYMASVA